MTDRILYSQANRRPRKSLINTQPEVAAKQEFAKDCDLNILLRKYKNDTRLLQPNLKPKQYADLTNIPDFAEIQGRIGAATDFFMSLPAIVRFELGNDVANLIHSSPEQLIALCKKHGTKPPLDVIGPTDTNQPVVSKKLNQKEIDNATESYEQESQQAKLPKRKPSQQTQP